MASVWSAVLDKLIPKRFRSFSWSSSSTQIAARGISDMPREVIVKILVDAAAKAAKSTEDRDHRAVLLSLALVCRRWYSVVKTPQFIRHYIKTLAEDPRGQFVTRPVSVKLYNGPAASNVTAIAVHRDKLFIAADLQNSSAKTIRILRTHAPHQKFRNLTMPMHNLTKEAIVISMRSCDMNDSVYICVFVPARGNIYRAYRVDAQVLKFRASWILGQVRWGVESFTVVQRNGNVIVIDVGNRVCTFDPQGRRLRSFSIPPSTFRKCQPSAILVLPDRGDSVDYYYILQERADENVVAAAGPNPLPVQPWVMKKMFHGPGYRQQSSELYVGLISINQLTNAATINFEADPRPFFSLLHAFDSGERLTMTIGNGCCSVQRTDSTQSVRLAPTCIAKCDLPSQFGLMPPKACYDPLRDQVYVVGNDGVYRFKITLTIPPEVLPPQPQQQQQQQQQPQQPQQQLQQQQQQQPQQQQLQ